MQEPQMFLIHFAGGNSYSFQEMMPHLTKFDAIPLELPGRGKRMREALTCDFDTAAIDISNQILKKLNTDLFIIYGHSMGASLALRVCHLLQKKNREPVFICVTGNPGPGSKENKKRYLLSKEDFLVELKKLGGVSEEFFNTPELMEFFEPILRADFEVAEKNNLKEDPPINLPIVVIMGDKEEGVEDILNWSNYTKAEFHFKIMEGDHFFIRNNFKAISNLIQKYYDKYTLF